MGGVMVIDNKTNFLGRCLNEGNTDLFYDTLFKMISEDIGFLDFSKLCGISRTHLYKIFKQKSTSLKRINMILGALGYSIIGTKK
jgi:DNA-binding phage protein